MSVIWGLKEIVEWKKETKWVVDKWDQKVEAADKAFMSMNQILEVNRKKELELKEGGVS